MAILLRRKPSGLRVGELMSSPAVTVAMTAPLVEAARIMQAAGLTAEADRRDGDAATEILAAANAFNADVILLGTHGRTGVARLVLGSVARNVLHHASSSVLVVRERRPKRTPDSVAERCRRHNAGVDRAHLLLLFTGLCSSDSMLPRYLAMASPT